MQPGRGAQPARAPGPPGGTWLFGRYRLETAARRLHAGERARELDPRAMAVLECLLRRAGQVVPRAVLIEEAWPGLDTVFDSAVSKVMRRLRLALEDGQGHVLQTIYGEGYRLALPATLLPPAPRAGGAAAGQEAPGPGGEARPREAAPLGHGRGPDTHPGPAAAPERALPDSPAAPRRAWLAWLPWGIAAASTLLAAWLAWLLLRPAGA